VVKTHITTPSLSHPELAIPGVPRTCARESRTTDGHAGASRNTWFLRSCHTCRHSGGRHSGGSFL